MSLLFFKSLMFLDGSFDSCVHSPQGEYCNMVESRVSNEKRKAKKEVNKKLIAKKITKDKKIKKDKATVH